MSSTKKSATVLPESGTDEFDVLERKYRYFETADIKVRIRLVARCENVCPNFSPEKQNLLKIPCECR
jgi:hypothetical protein